MKNYTLAHAKNDRAEREKFHVALRSASIDGRPGQVTEILHVRVVSNCGGGPDKTIMRSAQYLDPARYRSTAAYMYPRDDESFEALRNQATQEQCDLVELPEKGALDWDTLRRLVQLCQQRHIRIWHGHDYKSNLLGLLVKRQCPGLKLVSTVHGWTWDTLRTKLYYHLDNHCLKRYDEVIVVSPTLYDHCLKLGISADRLTYIPNAIRPEEYVRRQTPLQAKSQLSILTEDQPSASLVIGVVGRLSIEKGVDRAVKAMPHLPHAQLHLIGDGPQRESLERLARQLNVHDRVVFHGWQTSSQRFYEAMDLLLLPSHTEGLPNVVLEAMAMGVLVAATDVGGVRDLLDDGRCGVILPTEQPDQWPAMIQSQMADVSLCHQKVQQARQRIETHFTFASRMTRMMQVYDRLTGSLAQAA